MVDINDIITIDDLEGLSEDDFAFKPNITKMPSKFKELKVNLEDLESTIIDTESAEIKQVKIKDNDENNITLLYKLDIQLNDVIGKIFNTSHNFFIIVRDDRVIYANNSFLDTIGATDSKLVYNDKFFKFIVKEDWNILAKSIGEMLTGDATVTVRMSALNGRIIPVQFKAVYLPDNRHFTFILVGHRFYDKNEAYSFLYDPITGLPNYYLFEDRLQVAINKDTYASQKSGDMIGVAVVSIDNLHCYTPTDRQHTILRKMAEKLVFGLNKNYTVAAGLKYQFWILMPGIKGEEELRAEVRKIGQIFEQAVKDGIDELDIIASIGASLYPAPANSSYKLMENAIKAIIKAKEGGGNKVVFALD